MRLMPCIYSVGTMEQPTKTIATSYPLIGIRGDMGAGKDTLAAEIGLYFPEYTTRKFASKLREAASLIARIPAGQTVSDADKAIDLSGEPHEAYRLRRRIALAIECVTGVEPTPRLSVQMFLILTGEALYVPEEMVNIHMTVGRLLQVLGTECFRALVGTDVWVDALMAPWAQEGRPPVVIADTRFPNESAAIRRAGGVVILVRRADAGRADGRSGGHASERALDGEAPDFVLDNDGSVADLRAAFLAAWPAILAAAESRR